MTAHPTRTGAKRSVDAIRLLIIHTSEGGESVVSAENLAAFISTPRSATNLASYHYVFDTDRVIPVVPDNHVAYATGGANHDGLAACYPGKAGQTAEQWADPISSAMHEQAARWLADKSAEYDIPLRKLTSQQIVAGQSGVCGHFDVTLAYRKSTHTDPGPFYPWDSVLARARELAAPPPPPVIKPLEPAILPAIGFRMDSYLIHDRAVFGHDSALNVKQHVPDVPAWELQKALRVLADKPALPEYEADDVLMHATGPIIGPVPSGFDAYGASTG